jgi:hypothetical protein
MTKYRKMTWSSHVACIEKTKIHKNFGWKTLGEEGGLGGKMILKWIVET